jgi:hypothetical protein
MIPVRLLHNLVWRSSDRHLVMLLLAPQETMQIIENSNSQLILQNRPGQANKSLAGVCAALFIGMPLWWMGDIAVNLGVIQLVCDRLSSTQVHCKKHESKLIGLIPWSAESLEPITHAAFQVQETKYTVDLIGTQQVIGTIQNPTMLMEGDPAAMQQTVDQINAFIQSDRTTVVIQQDQRLDPQLLWIILFFSLFIGSDVAAIYICLKSEQLTFDRASNQITRELSTIFGQRSQTYLIRGISDIMINTRTDNDGDIIHDLNILPKHLYPHHVMRSMNRAEVEAIQGAIRDFLKLP